MTQPTIYIVMTAGDKPASALAREEGNPGEILETTDFGPDGLPVWTDAGICDGRGTSREAYLYLNESLDFAEANAKEIGFDIVRVPKERS